MQLEYQLIAAFVLDLFLGDPRWLPHPVRAIGSFAVALESPLRRIIPSARIAGILTVLMVVGLSASITWGIVHVCTQNHPIFGAAVSIVIIYSTIAVHDLASHARTVHWALERSRIKTARECVGRIVGRDTEGLDEAGITRATVESVAESIVDGITAPLFFAIIAGPAGAVAYRATNTLDSTFGYMNDEHREFGWASARLDDVANYIPARITAPIISLAALLLRLRAMQSLRTIFRDARKHSSPNAGFAESAVAGALGVQLGGLNHYFGQPEVKPFIGEPNEKLAAHHIRHSIRLAIVSSALFLVLVIICRSLTLLIVNSGGIWL
ncbi:MAG: adenosylcobinamide-phosphate synthase CbiB [Planctomycetota bacterium]